MNTTLIHEMTEIVAGNDLFFKPLSIADEPKLHFVDYDIGKNYQFCL